MSKFKYVGGKDGDQFFQGMPGVDLDDSTLTDGQKALLAAAVQKGVYAPLAAPAAPAVVKGKPDDKASA